MVSPSNYNSGTIDASGIAIVQAGWHGDQMPITVTLKSAAAGRAIQLSSDGGMEYYPLTYDVTSGTMVVVSITSPVSHIKLAGALGDTWSVR